MEILNKIKKIFSKKNTKFFVNPPPAQYKRPKSPPKPPPGGGGRSCDIYIIKETTIEEDSGIIQAYIGEGKYQSQLPKIERELKMPSTVKSPKKNINSTDKLHRKRCITDIYIDDE